MNEFRLHDPVAMPRGTSLSIQDGRGILVCVREGEVWLTQDGCLKDHLLRTGDSFRLDRNGTAIAHSFRRSALTLLAPERGRFARRISMTRPGSVFPVLLYQRKRLSIDEAWREMRARWIALWARAGAASS